MKKLLAVLCTLAMLVCMFSMTAAAEEVTYVQVTDLAEVKEGGDYVLVACYGGEYHMLDAYADTTCAKIDSSKALGKTATVTDGVLTVEGGDVPVWKVAAAEDGISIYREGEGYLTYGVDTSFTVPSETVYKWDIAEVGDGTFYITTNGGQNYLGFRDNSPNLRFGPWKSAKLGDAKFVLNLMLFKATTAGSGATPAPNPGPSIDDTADINTLPLYAVLAMGVAVVIFASKKKFAK